MNHPAVLAIGVLGAVVLILGRVYLDHTERGRFQARVTYGSRELPWLWRMAPVTSPALGVVLLVFSSLELWPRPLGVFVAAIGMSLFALVEVLAYRYPPPFMAGWMRDEIQQGRLARAMPRGVDRVWLWVFAPMIVLGPVATIVLVFVYGEGR
jgi:hypothetical protein